MAAAPIQREDILEDMVAALQAIDTRSDYNLNIRNDSVTRSIKPWKEVTKSDLPMLVVSDGSEAYNYTGMGKRVTNIFSIIIRGIVEDRYNSSQELNKLIADVKKAILVDLKRGTNTNNEYNASNTMLLRTDTDQGLASPRAVFEMEIQIIYHTLDTNR